MAKVTIKVPELGWRKETMEVPPGKTEVVKQALRAQQDRINQRLTRRNEEIARKLDEATRPSGGGKARWLTLGLGALVGTGIGILVAPTTGNRARTQVAQKAGKYARQAGQQTARQASYAASTVTGKAQTVTSKVGGKGQHDNSPQVVEQRVETELGEDRELRSLPRVNVNVEPGGVVYLRGALPSEDLKAKAEKIARKQRGVSEVVNEINVVTAGAEAFAYDSTQQDQELSTRVMDQLRGEKALQSVPQLDIEARSGGIVYLRGTVHNKSERDKAEKAARQVQGVNTVINDLAVVSPGPDIRGNDPDSLQ